MPAPRPQDLLIAIGDLHGHAPALTRLLAGLHARYRIFGRSRSDRLRPGVTLVFTGDYIDRGTRALAVIQRLRTLARNAPGRVVTLLGNHEQLALASLDAVDAVLEEACSDPVRVYEGLTVHGLNGGGAFVREFGDEPVAAMRAYRRRMSGSGDVGRWMRTLRPFHLAEVAGARVLVTHGDLPENHRTAGAFRRWGRRLDGVLSASSADLGGRAAKWDHPLLGDDSIVWSRSFSRLDPDDAGAAARICRALDVDFIVTGHTPHEEVTCTGGRIFDVDVGMTPAYGENEPQALVLEPGRATAFAASGRVRELARWSPVPDRSGPVRATA